MAGIDLLISPGCNGISVQNEIFLLATPRVESQDCWRQGSSEKLSTSASAISISIARSSPSFFSFPCFSPDPPVCSQSDLS